MHAPFIWNTLPVICRSAPINQFWQRFITKQPAQRLCSWFEEGPTRSDYHFNVSYTHTVVYSSLIFFLMTSSNGNIFRVTSPLCGEFTGPGEFPKQKPVTRSFDVFFDLRLNKRFSKQSWGWWFETLSWSLWRHCNVQRSPSTPRHSPHSRLRFCRLIMYIYYRLIC